MADKETEYERTAREGKHGVTGLAGIAFNPDLIPAGYDPESGTGSVRHPDAPAASTVVADTQANAAPSDVVSDQTAAPRKTASSRDKMK